MSITIHSIYIGQPRTMTHNEEEWSSSIYRTLVDGPIELGERSLAGDKVTDTEHHGRPSQAVCCHPMVHYEQWNQEYNIAGTDTALGPGSVGENWTILNADESTISAGDIYSIGTARVQVTGPRYPCFKQEYKTGLPGFLARTKETMRTGFYLSVLSTGSVQAGNTWTLEERPMPEITLASINEVIFQTQDPKTIQRLLELPELNEDWKSMLRWISEE